MEQQVNLYQPIMGAGNPIFSAQKSLLAVAVLVASLLAIAAFAASRVHRVERELTAIENQEALRAAATERAVAALQPAGGLEALEARLRGLAADVDEHQRVLEAVRRGAGDAAGEFSARLEALGRYRPEGLWLTGIELATGASALAMTGATNDPDLVPAYLGALAAEPSLAAARFDRFQLRLPREGEPAAAAIFEVGTADARQAASGPAP